MALNNILAVLMKTQCVSFTNVYILCGLGGHIVGVPLGVRQVGVVYVGGQDIVLGLYHRLGDLNSFYMVYWEVGGCYAESHGVGDVVDGLDQAVSVNVAVGATGDAVSGLDLGLGLGGV